ncbi:SRPBCC family protein [Candidatus Peribacteria bacterium]|nr:SRPBCC family protein [Candidatus Peribacteria bacterium]
MLKKLFLSLVVLIGLVLIVTYFLPRDFRLSKSVIINAPRENIYNFIRYLENQDQYSVWVMRDPNVQMTYTGKDGTVGAISAWVSDDKNVGIGEQEIKALIPNEKMTVEIRFKKPMEGVNYADTILESVGENQTKVTNTFYGSNPYPFNIMCQFMDMLVGGDMQQNMDNLKKIFEQE